MIPDLLTEQLEALRGAGHAADIVEAEGWFNLVLPEYALPAGYSKKLTQLLVKLPRSYPNGNPDMFWVDEDVRLQNGAIPRNADVVESALGRQWRRFSWHPQRWHPATDDLLTYLEFVSRRLGQVA